MVGALKEVNLSKLEQFDENANQSSENGKIVKAKSTLSSTDLAKVCLNDNAHRE